jgi:hypothetical protein
MAQHVNPMSNNESMELIAIEAAGSVALGNWEDDLVTREIGTAESVEEAIQRLEQIKKDCDSALQVVKEYLTKPLPMPTPVDEKVIQELIELARSRQWTAWRLSEMLDLHGEADSLEEAIRKTFKQGDSVDNTREVIQRGPGLWGKETEDESEKSQ